MVPAARVSDYAGWYKLVADTRAFSRRRKTPPVVARSEATKRTPAGRRLLRRCAPRDDRWRQDAIPVWINSRCQFALARLHPAPIINAQRHHLDRGDIIRNRDILVVGMHHRGGPGPKNDRWRVRILVEESRIRGALPPADLRILPGNFLVAAAHRLHDRVRARDLRRLRVISHEPHHRRMLLHPRILRRRAG